MVVKSKETIHVGNVLPNFYKFSFNTGPKTTKKLLVKEWVDEIENTFTKIRFGKNNHQYRIEDGFVELLFPTDYGEISINVRLYSFFKLIKDPATDMKNGVISTSGIHLGTEGSEYLLLNDDEWAEAIKSTKPVHKKTNVMFEKGDVLETLSGKNQVIYLGEHTKDGKTVYAYVDPWLAHILFTKIKYVKSLSNYVKANDQTNYMYVVRKFEKFINYNPEELYKQTTESNLNSSNGNKILKGIVDLYTLDDFTGEKSKIAKRLIDIIDQKDYNKLKSFKK